MANAYAAAQDLIDRYGEVELNQLGDRDGDGAWDSAVVNRAITDAEAEVDAALAARYALPLAAIPDLLVGVVCDIARYRLWVDGAPDRVRDAASNARKILAALSAGSMSLGLASTQAPAVAGGVKHSASDAVFDASEGF